MRNRGGMLLGGALILFGSLALLSEVLDVRLGFLFWPLALIAAGIFILVRPKTGVSGAPVTMRLFGDDRRSGPWQAGHEELWSFIGDVYLDLTQAKIEPGEIHYRVLSFIGDVELVVPEGMGVSVSSVGFVTEASLFGTTMGGFLSPVDWSSDGYAEAESRIRLEMISFIGELDLRRA